MQAKTFGTASSARRACMIALILAGLLAQPALAATRAITGVDVADQADRVVITVKANGPLTMTPVVSSRGQYIGFQFPCKLATTGRLVRIQGNSIYNVRYSNFKPNPPTTRIVVNTAKHLDYSTEWLSDKSRVQISVWKGNKPAPVAANTAVKGETQAVVDTPASAQVAVQPVRPGPAAGISHTAEGSDIGEPAEPAAPVVSAAPASAVRPTAAAKPVKPVTVARLEPVAQPPSAARNVSLNFLGADIQDVLKALSVQSGENIVSSKDVSGEVTVSLNDVSVEQALDYVARLSGYGYAREGNTYLVGSKESLRSITDAQSTAAPKVEVVALNHANVKETIALLKTQYPEVNASASGETGGKDDKDKAPTRGGLLVLSGTDTQIAGARELVAQVDSSVGSIVGGTVTEVYRVQYVSAQELMNTLVVLVPDVEIAYGPSEGFDLRAPSAVTINLGNAAAGTSVEQERQVKTADELGYIQALVLTGSQASVQRALDVAARLDVRSPQIKIDAKVTSLTESGEKRLGVSWDWGAFGFLEGFTDFDKATSLTGSTTENLHNVRVSEKRWFRQPWDVIATLDALIEEGEGQLLAAPSIVTLEGKPGMFFVGDEVRYIVLVQQTTTGQNVVTETANVGVQLRVNGDVSPDGYITLNLHPEVSVLQLEKDVATGITLPIITRRFTDHVVRVKSGETIVIGGLIRDEELEVMSKVPILGDLPILGKLFRHKQKTSNHSEVVMFITATILED